MKRMPPLALVIATLACSSPSEPPSEPLELAFEAREVQEFEAEPEIEASGGEGQVIVRGGLWTGCGGYTLDAEASAGSDLTLRVIANANSPQKACYGIVESFEYEAILRGLSRGAYQLRLLHVYQWWEDDPEPEVRRSEIFSVRVR